MYFSVLEKDIEGNKPVEALREHFIKYREERLFLFFFMNQAEEYLGVLILDW